jgi:magnesium chelatase subunit D
LLIVVTDGRATSGSDADLTRATAMLAGVTSVVVDCEASVLRLGLAERLAVRLGASLFRLDELDAGSSGFSGSTGSSGSALATVARQLTGGMVA